MVWKIQVWFGIGLALVWHWSRVRKYAIGARQPQAIVGKIEVVWPQGKVAAKFVQEGRVMMRGLSIENNRSSEITLATTRTNLPVPSKDLQISR